MPKNKSVGGRKSVKIKKLAPKRAKPIYVSDDDMPDEAAESFYKDAIDLHNDQSRLIILLNIHQISRKYAQLCAKSVSSVQTILAKSK